MKRELLINSGVFITVIFLAQMTVNILVPKESNIPTLQPVIKEGLLISGPGVETGYLITSKGQQMSPDIKIPGKSRSRTEILSRQAVAMFDKKLPEQNQQVKEAGGKEKNTPEELNPYSIEEIIKTTGETYYFSDKSLTKDNVTVELLCLTPRLKKDYILKFRVINMSKEYFIPQSVLIQHRDQAIDTRLWLSHIIESGKTAIGYLWVKESADYARTSGQRLFQLFESGGKYRKFSIYY